MNLAEKIGTHYFNFGILLLEDNDGTITNNLKREHQERAQDINQQVFCLWLKGRGRKPTSWATLATVLQELGLNRLAREIEQAKLPKETTL